MHWKSILIFLLASGLVIGSCKNGPSEHTGAEQPAYERIVALSGGITETIFALGQGNKIVGVDVTSTYPDAVKEIAQLGHVGKLNTEAVLGLQPDLIIAEANDSSQVALQQLSRAGIEVLYLESSYTLDRPLQQAAILAQKLGSQTEYQRLVDAHQQHSTKLDAILDGQPYEPKVLFVYARGKGSMMVAGQNTAASAMITLSGGQNAISSFEGFRALSPEGLIETKPEVILLFDSGLKSLGGPEGLLSVPGMEQTPAGKHQRIIAMDGLYLLGFTPRVAAAAVELATQLQAFQYESSQLSEQYPKSIR